MNLESLIETGQVLGETASQLTLTALNNIFHAQIGSGFTDADYQALGIGLLAGLLLLAVLLGINWILFGKRQQGRFTRGLVIILLSIGLVWFHIWYLVTISQPREEKKMQENSQPQEVQLQRLSQEVAIVIWQTAAKSVGGVLWGYSPDHLDNLVLSDHGSQSELVHRAVIDVEPEAQVYLVIISNGYKFFDQDEPYRLGLSSNYQLEPINAEPKI